MPDADPVRRGRLKKLTRSATSRTFDTWQARDAEVDAASGTFAYASNDKPRKAMTLAGAKARVLEGKFKGKPFVFVVDFASGEPLTLACTSAEDRNMWVRAVKAACKALAIRRHRAGEGLAPDQAWPEARKYKSGEKADRATSRDVDRLQDETLDVVGRMRRQLSGTREVAAATTDTLKQQGEQVEAVTRDLGKMNHELAQADRNLSQLESWRIFGGKSKRKGRKAEKLARAHSSRGDDETGEAKSDSPPRRRRSSRTKEEATPTPPRRPSRSNVAQGLEGRDVEENAQLDRIRRKDDAVNSGLDEIDSMLDALSGDAKRMNAQVRRQNSRLGVMGEALGESEARTANVNARARHNVGYYGRPDLWLLCGGLSCVTMMSIFYLSDESGACH